MRPSTRVPGEELMDGPEVEPAALEESLGDLRLVNRWLGGSRAALIAVLPVVREVDAAQVRVLDVATGSADIPLALARRARAEGVGIRVVATDAHPTTLAEAERNAAGEPAVELARADALALPFDAGAFHVAMCHTALHHFTDQEARRVLAELGRVATDRVVVTDLARGRFAAAGVAALAATIWRRHPVTRHDSIVSIRAAFTPDEARELAAAAGLRELRTRRHPFFRFSLVARPAGWRS